MGTHAHDAGAVREADGVPDMLPPPQVDPYGALVEVDDPEDPRLGAYRNLNDPARRGRVEADASIFVVEGRLAVERLLTSGYAVRSLLVDDHQLSSSAGLVDAVRAGGAPVLVGTREVVAATVGFALHRGVVAVADRPAPVDADALLADLAAGAGDPPLVAVLEGLNDHENVGALFRNAAAFGVSGILLDPTCADPLYRRSVRVSMGHVLHVPFARLAPWPAGLDRLRAAGFVVAALAPHLSSGGVPRLSLAALRDRRTADGAGMALLLGAEGLGLSEEALAAADVVVAIPMADGIDSLNVATAAAVALYALVQG
jgi:tRNA G18 (ribose-2'-O)-methylase SpoU